MAGKIESNDLIHKIDANNSKKQAWFNHANVRHSPDSPGNEALIEAQVLRLMEECRLFSQEEETTSATTNINTNDNDNDETAADKINNTNRSSDNSLALFHRHEIKTSWNILGNGGTFFFFSTCLCVDVSFSIILNDTTYKYINNAYILFVAC